MMPFSPYLNFNGNTKEAIMFYKEAFDAGEIEIMYFKDMPEDENFSITDENKDLIMHAEMKIKDTWFMFSDVPPDKEVKFGDNLTLMYASADLDEIKNAYNKLKEDGKVQMELQETFWSKAYGYLVDKFGVGWQFNLNNE
jgi:PhnB protein